MGGKNSGRKPKNKEPKEKKKKQPTLTQKQSRFAQALMQERNMSKAALLAGYSTKSVGKSAHQALQAIQKKVPTIMDELGLSVNVLIQKHLVPLLNATTTKLATDEGEFTDYVDLEDNNARFNALDAAFRLHGAYAPKEQITRESSVMHVLINDIPAPRPPQQKVIDVDGNGAKGNGQPPKK